MRKDRYIPKNLKYPYPIDTAEHYLKIKMDRGFIFDENYPYIDNSKAFKRKQLFVRFLLNFIVFPLTRIKMGLKIIGKENLTKDLFNDGLILVSNHIHMWDYIAIMKALKPHHTNVLVWDKNVNDKDGNLVRLVGGIPIPKKLSGTKAYFKAINDLLNNKGILHIYAEGSMWEYYPYIRPFKSGFATIAMKNNKNVLPIGFSYRKPSWFRKYIMHQEASITLNIGQVIKIDGLNKEELINECHNKVCNLAFIDNNPYEAIYNNSKRIDGILDEDK